MSEGKAAVTSFKRDASTEGMGIIVDESDAVDGTAEEETDTDSDVETGTDCDNLDTDGPNANGNEGYEVVGKDTDDEEEIIDADRDVGTSVAGVNCDSGVDMDPEGSDTEAAGVDVVAPALREVAVASTTNAL